MKIRSLARSGLRRSGSPSVAEHQYNSISIVRHGDESSPESLTLRLDRGMNSVYPPGNCVEMPFGVAVPRASTLRQSWLVACKTHRTGLFAERAQVQVSSCGGRAKAGTTFRFRPCLTDCLTTAPRHLITSSILSCVTCPVRSVSRATLISSHNPHIYP